ncbi:condensation domain-containing protein [Acrocarpospora catenulata]|uniref:condensation domain-containing protein n=1 Tax=Acrocarpospora catenulata TaxID=2836182 RepID=UPI001BDB5701|nr:condensation domain-containing protein [Acrocarpospora catenulata]
MISRQIPELAGHPAITVAFQAQGEPATGPLTWAQQHMLALMADLEPDSRSVNLRFTCALRSGLTVAEVTEGLRDLMTHFDALRTVYVPPPSGPAQRVLTDGELVVPVVEAAKGTAAATAGRLAADMWALAFDVSGEWPLRAALVTTDGEPRQLVFVGSHLVLDQTGTQWLQYHLRGLLARPPAPVRGPELVHRPLDEAEWEKSDTGQRHSERALAHHEATLRAMPQTMLPRTTALREAVAALPHATALPATVLPHATALPATALPHATALPATALPRTTALPATALPATALPATALPAITLPHATAELERPRFRYLRFDSPALAAAVTVLAARHQVSPASVLFAGINAVAAHVSSLDRSFLQLTVGNRIAPRTRYAVGMHTQDVPVCVPVSDLALSELIVRSGAELTRAARFGQHPPSELAARRREIELERGIRFDLSCWLNYRRLGTARPPRVTPADLDKTVWRWEEGVDSSTSTYFIFADDAGDLIRLTLLLDTAILPPEEALAWLRALESLLCTACTTEIGTSEIGAHTGLSTTPRDLDWVCTPGGWAHLPSVTDLVRRCAGSPRAQVVAEGGSLVAYLDEKQDLTDLHERIVAALDRVTVAPHRYVLCADAPGPGVPVLAEGTGRP